MANEGQGQPTVKYDSEVDPMPVFVLHGKDRLAIETIKFYRNLCIVNGLYDQMREVEKALDEMYEWVERNPDQMKFPDHEHIGAGDPRS